MKVNEVPQDDANMLDGKLKEPCYAVDENGNYTTIKSVGWEAKNIVMQQAWSNISSKIDEVRLKVLDKKLSPIAYYMEKNIMSPKLLSQYTGFFTLTVKRHMKYKSFVKLPDEKLKKYADTFDITVEELKDLSLLKLESVNNAE